MAHIDFDLARYIAHRKGRVLQRARDGAAYGYSGEIRQRRNLIALRPVAFAIDATSRHWKGNAKRALLEGSTRASSKDVPRLYQAANQASAALSLENCPPIYLSRQDAPVGAFALGSDDDSLLIVHPDWLEGLSDGELVSLVARTLGYVQNNLVPLTTTLYYLEHDAFFFVRWVVSPALLALRSWSRRADISCDRAGLIATRDLGISVSSILRTSGAYTGPLDYDRLAANEPFTQGPLAELLESKGPLRHRIGALKVFSQTYLYSQLKGNPDPDGLSTDQADDAVRIILEK